jgi:hypothetical protein
MGRGSRNRRAVLLLACAALLATFVGGADAALVKVGNLVLRADGGFTPSSLPRDSYAPIDFKGYATITDTSGAQPTPLQEVILDFDRDGRLSTKGIPICPLQEIASANTSEARKRCADSIVGAGTVDAILNLPDGPIKGRVKATLFNAPRQGGHPTVIAHAFSDIPAPRTYAIVIPIERRGGAFAYRARFDIPKIAADGVLTRAQIRVGLRYRFKGKERSYASARCTSGVLRTHGRFTFADGTIIDGSIEKPCTPRS